MTEKEFYLEHNHVLENTKVILDSERDLVTIKIADMITYFTFEEIKKIYKNIIELETHGEKP